MIPTLHPHIPHNPSRLQMKMQRSVIAAIIQPLPNSPRLSLPLFLLHCVSEAFHHKRLRLHPDYNTISFLRITLHPPPNRTPPLRRISFPQARVPKDDSSLTERDHRPPPEIPHHFSLECHTLHPPLPAALDLPRQPVGGQTETCFLPPQRIAVPPPPPRSP